MNAHPFISGSLSLCLSLCLSTGSALGYSIHSGLTDGCHEQITRNALQMALPNLTPNASIPIPESKTWVRFADSILQDAQMNGLARADDERFKLMLVSLIIGVRSPDTEGHAVTNFSSLRQIHADPSPEGQYAHALRGPDDDGPEGDETAVNGTRAAIAELIRSVVLSFKEKPPEEQIITVQLYFDFYGLVDIEVWEPAYLVGRSLHALQDSFAHTIRSDDLKRIRHVLNYVDAIAGDLKESVDGLPHSTHMDHCEGETSVIAETATIASASLIESLNQAVVISDVSPIFETLDEWVTYEPGCTVDNDYCDSIWLEAARKEPTGPYLEEFLGCEASAHSSHPVSLLIGLLFLSLYSYGQRQRQRQRQRHVCLTTGLGAVLGAVSIIATHHDIAHAKSHVQAEIHASLLSDTPDRSVLASTYGWGIRGGYTWGSWVALAHVEQNKWLSTELTDRTREGVLNAGIGGAYLYGGGFVRTSLVIGTSALLFDTIFDDEGTTGLFFDMRPVELRWSPLEWLSLNLTPLSFTYVAPVLEEPALKMVVYRTVFGAEAQF